MEIRPSIRLVDATYTYPHASAPSVRGVTLSVAPGELKLVTGPSGCGKTTLMRLVNGIAPQIAGGTLEGRVEVDGLDTAATPVAVLSEHAGTLFQDPEEQFFALSVKDEITFALKSRGLAPEEIDRRLDRAARLLGLESLLSRDIHTLSEGQKQKTGLAAILALGPKALILDEPTANLDPEATERLADILGELKAAGTAILVVDHRLYWLRDRADEVLVMAGGEIVRRGPFSMLENEETTRALGLRRARVLDPRPLLPKVAVSALEEPLPAAFADPAARFAAEGLAFGYPGKPAIFESVGFSVSKGITALIGESGAGKTTLARILTGLEKARGRLTVEGRAVGREGMMPLAGLVLQNADHQLQMRTVREEVEGAVRAALAAEARRKGRSGFFGRLRLVRPSAEDERRIDELLAALGIAHLADRHPQSLSGGEKQRLVIACALAKDPAVLILDEPTSGLDGANLRSIAELLSAEAGKGRAVFLITHDLELLETCDAALDMADIRRAAERSRSTLTQALKAAADKGSNAARVE